MISYNQTKIAGTLYGELSTFMIIPRWIFP